MMSKVLSACLYNDSGGFIAVECVLDQLIRQYTIWERTIEKKYTLAASVDR